METEDLESNDKEGSAARVRHDGPAYAGDNAGSGQVFQSVVHFLARRIIRIGRGLGGIGGIGVPSSGAADKPPEDPDVGKHHQQSNDHGYQ